MHRIDDPTAVPTLPAPRPPGTPGYFSGGAPGEGGFLATVVRYEFMNSIQEELSHVVEQSGLTLDKLDNNQLMKALNRLFVKRTLATAHVTIYVNPVTGNDGNSGLSAAAALRTIQMAINIVYYTYDWNGNGCTIQLADGTYNEVSGANSWLAYFPGRPLAMPQFGLTLRGNPSAPQNVVLHNVGGSCVQLDAAMMFLDGFTVTGTGMNWTLTQVQGMGISVARGGWAECTNIRCAGCEMFGLRTDWNGVITLRGSNIHLTGAGEYGVFAGYGGTIWTPGSTINVTGWSARVALWMSEQGRLEVETTTFVGAATGTRYWVLDCGLIITGGAGINYLPGSAPGVVSTGGIYS